MRFIVRAVQQRGKFVEYLTEHLQFAEWCFDRKHNAMDTFLMALEMAGSDACVHMEDDVILTRDFHSKILTEIARRPDEVIQFFSMRSADVTVGSRYDRSFLMGQCFYLPSGYSKHILDYWPTWLGKEEHPTGLDTMVCDFLKGRREAYWIHVPSLVEHRICTSIINPRRSSKRQSMTFIDPIL